MCQMSTDYNMVKSSSPVTPRTAGEYQQMIFVNKQNFLSTNDVQVHHTIFSILNVPACFYGSFAEVEISHAKSTNPD